ncbi:MAG: hypothetical protein LJE69_15025 [Thiohalocapsa sp.]|uniref:hypothetical protein n=1 Tax=Thiohalocapsa sp. TaxID=2497641 RepID=UPI0025F7FD37|nr:hypothetical protein [Thiohalocapsa sp.]MCG6942550.1 hypothetical protein [Thiohalocapsa sp.]
MATIITAQYQNNQAAGNAVDDLISTGVPQERIATDPDHWRVIVTTGPLAEPEIAEILNRHQPTEMHTRAGD